MWHSAKQPQPIKRRPTSNCFIPQPADLEAVSFQTPSKASYTTAFHLLRPQHCRQRPATCVPIAYSSFLPYVSYIPSFSLLTLSFPTVFPIKFLVPCFPKILEVSDIGALEYVEGFNLWFLTRVLPYFSE